MSKRRSRARPKPSNPRAIGEMTPAELQAGERPSPERAAKGRFVREKIMATLTDGDGEPKPGKEAKHVLSFRRRDADMDLRNLPRRFKRLTPTHVHAAILLNQDYEEAQLEPRITVDLQSSGGGGCASSFDYGALNRVVKEARDRVHAALNFLRLGGDEATRVVEAVVLQGMTSAAAGAARHARGRDATVSVSASLEAGLSLLAAHYVKEGRMAQRQQQEQAA